MSGVGDGVTAHNARWTFGGEVADHFDEHVSKSVPLYREGHDLICDFSDYFLKDHGLVYELGCSTGELLMKIAKQQKDRGIRFIGLDVETGMIAKAKQRQNEIGQTAVDFEVADITEFEFEKADLIVCYYTLQFISPAVRQHIVEKIFEALNWGGAFILYEKVRGSDARFQDYLTGIYNEYKLRQGYDPSEIFAKTRSLKGILEPFSSKGNFELLERAGFKDIYTIQKYICFEGICAIK